jgi:hypothetical protein
MKPYMKSVAARQYRSAQSAISSSAEEGRILQPESASTAQTVNTVTMTVRVVHSMMSLAIPVRRTSA